MKVIYDILQKRGLIKQSISKYGYFAEHNFDHYAHHETSEDKNLFFDFGSKKGALVQYDEYQNVYTLFPCGILAPENEQKDLLLQVADYCLKQEKAQKLVVELQAGLRGQILERFARYNTFRAKKYTYVLYWPMYNMENWNTRLPGSKLKKLRNIRNRFFKRMGARVRDCKNVPKDELKRIVDTWLRNRRVVESVDNRYYHNVIDSGFKGCDVAKCIYINGSPRTITAGWKIPNSKNYYSAIGLFDYSYPGLGELANLDDLSRLKRKNYSYVDFGGSDKILLTFKRKFKPEKIYKTYSFSIVRS